MGDPTVAGSGVADPAQELQLAIPSASPANKSSASGRAGSHISSFGAITKQRHQVLTILGRLGFRIRWEALMVEPRGFPRASQLKLPPTLELPSASPGVRHPSRKEVTSSCPDDGPLCLQRCTSPALTSLMPCTTGREQKLSARNADNWT